MSWACGWCLAFNDECCEGRVTGCSHGGRCSSVFTERQKEIARQDAITTERTFAELRRKRLEGQMTGRIRAAWAQLDVATDEIVRLMGLIKRMEGMEDNPAPGFIESFQRDLDLEKARARGKAEILALIMPAPLNTAEAVSKEAGLRFQARQQGKERDTPGIRMVAKTVMDDLEPNEAWT